MEEYKQAKAHWKVLHRDKNKGNIPRALDEVEPKC